MDETDTTEAQVWSCVVRSVLMLACDSILHPEWVCTRGVDRARSHSDYVIRFLLFPVFLVSFALFPFLITAARSSESVQPAPHFHSSIPLEPRTPHPLPFCWIQLIKMGRDQKDARSLTRVMFFWEMQICVIDGCPVWKSLRDKE